MAEILPLRRKIIFNQSINQSKLNALTKFTYEEGRRFTTAFTGPASFFSEPQIAAGPCSWGKFVEESTTSGFIEGPVTVNEGGSFKKIQIIHEFDDVHRQCFFYLGGGGGRGVVKLSFQITDEEV